MKRKQMLPSNPSTIDIPISLDLYRWIAENAHQLEPPTSAHTIFNHDDFMVTMVGGPNTRNDYHVNPAEEIFFQLRGTVIIRVQHHGNPHDIVLAPGSMYVLPARVPHSPIRGAGTAGLVIERVRGKGMIDAHEWHCEICNHLLFRREVEIEVLERDMPPVFEAYYNDPHNQVCRSCGHRNPGRPTGPRASVSQR